MESSPVEKLAGAILPGAGWHTTCTNRICEPATETLVRYAAKAHPPAYIQPTMIPSAVSTQSVSGIRRCGASSAAELAVQSWQKCVTRRLSDSSWPSKPGADTFLRPPLSGHVQGRRRPVLGLICSRSSSQCRLWCHQCHSCSLFGKKLVCLITALTLLPPPFLGDEMMFMRLLEGSNDLRRDYKDIWRS
jgi:hypothetical protein